MTPTDQLAAIRAALTDRWNDDGTAPDDFDILNDIQNILAAEQPTPEPLVLPPFLVVASEYGTIVGASPCDSEAEADEIAEEDYNAHRHHTHGDVIRLKWWAVGKRYDTPVNLHANA